ncbi:MAG: endonuclease/exonuclease/phosphatase family protein [Bdellovibrionota bacterium]
MRLKIVSWNVHRCIGTDGHYRPERIAEVLGNLEPDIVALQEIDSSLRTHGEVDQLTYIAKAVGLQQMMGPTLQRDYGAYGNALLYRAPLVGAETCDLSFRKFEPRGAIAVHLRFGSGVLRVVNCHLGLKYWERTFQIDRLLREFVWRDGAFTCLLGDFNEWLAFSPNALRLQRSLEAVERKPTFPAGWPRLSLDRIFFNWPARVTDSFTLTNGLARIASDHLPICATFEWNERDALPLS